MSNPLNKIFLKKSGLFILVILIVFALQGCDFFVAKRIGFDRVMGSMDRVFLAEDNFTSEINKYFALSVRNDIAIDFVNYVFNEFSLSYNGLNRVLDETEFTEEQKIANEKFYTFYKPYLDEYMAFSQTLFEDIKNNGYSVDWLDDELETLQEYSDKFFFVHNEMINVWLNEEYHISIIDF